MDSTPNVVRAGELEWESRRLANRPPFGGRIKRAAHLPRIELGFHFQELEPGCRSCPLHDHLFEEEHFYVLEGTLTVTERTPAGKRREFELHPGELIAYPAGTRLAHGFSNRGASTAVFLAFSELIAGDICTYPDSGKTALRGIAVGAWHASAATPGDAGAGAKDAAAVLAAARARRLREPVETLSDAERPSHVAPKSLAEGRLGDDLASGAGTALSRTARASALFAYRERFAAGASPLHRYRHRYNEEVLLVLAGQVRLRQEGADGASDCILSPGDLAHFPPGSVPRQLSNAEAADALVLRFGTNRPYNIVELGDARELYSAAFGERGRLESLDYYAGETEESA